ncbi:MAG: helix-turn-helix transcriptional regulator [Rhodococcus sp. (in: high G+C Gram-positive bacteria)]
MRTLGDELGRRGEPATVSLLRDALCRRTIGGGLVPYIDDVTLEAVLGCTIETDDVDLCASALLDMGPTTVVDALENGGRWAGFVERLARSPITVGGAGTLSAHARELLRWLHVGTGTAFVSMLRSVVAPATEIELAIDELAVARLVRVTYPVHGPASEHGGPKVSLGLAGLAVAADETRSWAMSGGAELLPSMAVAADTWVRDQLRSAADDPARIVGHVCALRRHGLVAVERLAAAQRWDDVAEIAETMAPALVSAGIHRCLLRKIGALLDRSAPAEVQRRLRLAAAQLHLASGNVVVSRHLLDSAAVLGRDDELRWRADMHAAVWARDIDASSVLRTVEAHVISGGSHLSAADITLDLASRLLRDSRPSDAADVLVAAGAHAAVSGDELLLARLDVVSSIAAAQTGDAAGGRQRLGAAYPIAAARGVHTFVHLVAGSTGSAQHDTAADNAAHLTMVVDLLLTSNAFDLDRPRILATALADLGSDRVDGGPVPAEKPALNAITAMYPATGSNAENPHLDRIYRSVRDPEEITLTARESQVAELVAAGLSNVAIAQRLTISRWTVVSHLRSIMRKWDCTSRVEVAVKYRP